MAAERQPLCFYANAQKIPPSCCNSNSGGGMVYWIIRNFNRIGMATFSGGTDQATLTSIPLILLPAS